MSGLSPIPQTAVITDGKGNLSPTYQQWFQSIQRWLSPVGQSDITANRPIKNLYIGQPFFDTTLGYMIWVKYVGPPAVWVNGAGSAV